MTTLSKIKEIIVDYMKYDVQEIPKLTRKITFKQLNLDSLDIVELVMRIEDEFGINDEMLMCIDIGDVADLVDKLLKAKEL